MYDYERERMCRAVREEGLSRKFCSAENFGPGPIFSEKIVPFRNDFFEKNGLVLKILFWLTFLQYPYATISE